MTGIPCFEYGSEAIDLLKSRDAALGAVINRIGLIRRQVWPDLFTGFMRTISGQQISSKAHVSVWQKFTSAYGEPDPGKIAVLNPEDLRDCGISRQKAAYMIAIAREFANGNLNQGELAARESETLRKELKKYPGIGDWTVDMLLIFTFQRKNQLSFGDLALKRGMRILYGHKEITREIFDDHYRAYSPYATIAGFYLWEVAASGRPGS